MNDSKISDSYSGLDTSEFNYKKKYLNESERKIFVKHCIQRGVITGLIFSLIQCGILINNFLLGEYDPKLIMMNPLLILIKSINYLHISFTK